MDNEIVEEKVSPIMNDSLIEFVPIKKMSPINENLWNDTERMRRRNIEMDIVFENPVEEKKKEKEAVKSKKMGTAAFTSISLMIISTSIATAAIIVFGVLLTK